MKEVKRDELISIESESVLVTSLPPPASPPYMEKDVVVVGARRGRPKLRWGRRKIITRDQIVQAVMKDFGRWGYPLHMSDSRYREYTLDEVRLFLSRDNTSDTHYVSEDFDCDDFTQVLAGRVNGSMIGIPLGSIWYGGFRGRVPWGHAACVFYDADTDKIYLIEPQDDTVYEWKPEWRCTFIII